MANSVTLEHTAVTVKHLTYHHVLTVDEADSHCGFDLRHPGQAVVDFPHQILDD